MVLVVGTALGVAVFLWASVNRETVDTQGARSRIAEMGNHPSDATTASTPTTPTTPAGPTTPSAPDDGTVALTDDLVVLVVGSDERPSLGGKRADVVMVATVPKDTSQPVQLVSLPRDLVVEVPCRGTTRINAALGGCPKASVSGLELMAITVEDWAGVDIDHVVAVDFGGFAGLVDLAGGYELCLEHPVRDTKAKLELDAGCQRLSGQQTLAWVRSRRTQQLVDGRWRTVPGVSDLTRTQRQREVVAYLLRRLREADLGETLRLIRAGIAMVTIDSQLGVGRIAELARAAAQREIVGGTVGVRDARGPHGEAWLVATETYDQAVSRILNGDTPTTTPTTTTVPTRRQFPVE